MSKPTIIGKPVILIVDDNPEWIESVDFNLGDKYMVIAASDLADSIRMCEQYAPEVMLLDWTLARMDPERARAGLMTRSDTLLPVILVTGVDRPEVENIADVIGGCVAVFERLGTLEDLEREIDQVVSCAAKGGR
jgi:CheY-like chemotaxis protein